LGLSEPIRDAVSDALRRAFDGGFSGAAWTAARVALAAGVLTWLVMPGAQAANVKLAEPRPLAAPAD
jgi:hypothetical protein